MVPGGCVGPLVAVWGPWWQCGVPGGFAGPLVAVRGLWCLYGVPGGCVGPLVAVWGLWWGLRSRRVEGGQSMLSSLPWNGSGDILPSPMSAILSHCPHHQFGSALKEQLMERLEHKIETCCSCPPSPPSPHSPHPPHFASGCFGTSVCRGLLCTQ